MFTRGRSDGNVRRFGASSPNLGKAFQTLLLQLYKSWYDLPKKSTRRYIDLWRFEYAAQIVNGTLENELFRAFLSDLARMTGVKEVAQTELEQAQRSLGDSGGAIAVEEATKLSATLLTEDPVGFVIQQMVYDPAQVEPLFEEVRSMLTRSERTLPDELHRQLEAIWTDFDGALDSTPKSFAESRQPYVDALTKLEQIPAAIRLTYKLFLAAKVDDASQIRTNRSVGKGLSPASDVYRGGSKSPFGGGTSRGGLESTDPIGGALESFSPDLGLPEMAAEDAPEMATDEMITEADEMNEGETVGLSPDVRFPTRVKRGDEVPLIVQLTQEQASESRVVGVEVPVQFSDSAQPEYVDVVLSATGFSERTDIWSRTITVHATQDSQPAIFLLKGIEDGDHALTIAFYHRGKPLGQVKVASTVSLHTTSMGTTPDVLQATAIAAPKPSTSKPADLELRITQGSEKNKLQFMLHSSKASVGYHWRPMGETVLAVENPQKYLEFKFERMSSLARQITANTDSATLRQVMDELETLGEGLFEDLFPEKLQQEYFKRIKRLRKEGVITSFMVTSDEPWIPWEMVKPYFDDVENDQEETDGFLCIEFDFCRWLAGQSPKDLLDVDVIKTVIPHLDLSFAQKEQRYFQSLSERGVAVEGPLTKPNDVLDSTKRGGFQVMHFALHGTFEAEQPSQAALVLEGNEQLLLEDLGQRQLRGMRRSNPIVFINACHAARMNFSLTGLGGWAETMVNDGRVSAFIGAQWEVNDELALTFATTFYDELRAGHTLGKAFNSARRATREQAPANPTWLAYTLYGDPNGQVTWPE